MNVEYSTMVNTVSSALLKYWKNVIEHFENPFGRYCVKSYYAIYAHFTLFNVMVFVLKCVPIGTYMYKFIKNIHIASSERLKSKRIEVEDIQLQIQIVRTKLKLRDAEFSERADLLRRKLEKLRKVRKQVQEIIAADDELRDTIKCSPQDNETNYNVGNTADEESNFFVELLKELKHDQVVVSEQEKEKKNAEQPGEGISADNSVYSSAHDDNKQDYHVKIVKVTNVYKVAYLRHFIKQKKLRRAIKQTLLRKRMEKIKKLFDAWQDTLKMVINNKLSMVDMDSQRLVIASHEAMGDFSKANFNNSMDSDSDCRNSADGYQDEYCVSWEQNQYRPVFNNDYNMNIVRRECYDVEECFNKYNSQDERFNCNSADTLFAVPEETISQVEIDEIKSEMQ